jgi:hypothetical protein
MPSFFTPFDATNTGRQIGAEKTAVGRFVGEPAHGAKTQINRAGGEFPGFQMRAIAQDYDPVEGQARFRTIPVNELIDGVTITPLCVCRVRLFNTAALACSRSGNRRTDLALLRLLLELGFCFMTGGLHATDQ